MYDVPFSEHWILDFCLNPLNVILVFFVIPIICIILWFFLLKKAKIKLHGSIIFLMLVAFFPLWFMYMVLMMFLGFSSCSMRTFYKGIEPAHLIHAQIKERIKQNNDVPQSLEDLQKMDPKNYALMTQHAKVNYIYDEKAKNYTFFVRPSVHKAAVFDSKNDYKLYQLTYIFPKKIEFSILAGTYPPDYPGPWDKLPK